MKSTKKSTSAWEKLIEDLNHKRAAEQRKYHRKELALVRKGSVPTTEHYAYPYVLHYVTHDSQRTAILRAAGLMCEFPDIPQVSEDPYLSLGKSFLRGSFVLDRKHSGKSHFSPDAKNPDAIAARLKTLPSQDLEGCVRVLRSIFQLMRGTGVPVDFHDLMKTLICWGDGISSQSVDIRLKLVRDYYSEGIKIHDSPVGDSMSTPSDTTEEE